MARYAERELSRSEREGKSAAIILAAIDHFKKINDALGHPAGDAVLKEVAQRLGSDLKAIIDFDLLLQRWFPLRLLTLAKNKALSLKLI